MLYVDSPVQTGYSYTNAQNGSVDLFTGQFTPLSNPDDKVATNLTTVQGTLSSQSLTDTLNTTQQVARVMWLFSQVWFQEFPEQMTDNKEINIWGFSVSFVKPVNVIRCIELSLTLLRIIVFRILCPSDFRLLPAPEREDQQRYHCRQQSKGSSAWDHRHKQWLHRQRGTDFLVPRVCVQQHVRRPNDQQGHLRYLKSEYNQAWGLYGCD